tara:strand:+ start:4105 stop:4443 length:339 start_codon:yes stop_codon:yes gene_type:complete
MVLYHITKVENIESIMEKGILPNYKKGITCGGRKQTQVFLTNDINKVIKTQIGSVWENEIAIFEVEVHNIEPHRYYCFEPPKDSDFEFVTDKVDTENIKNILKTCISDIYFR